MWVLFVVPLLFMAFLAVRQTQRERRYDIIYVLRGGLRVFVILLLVLILLGRIG